jgi:hypothetical protein
MLWGIGEISLSNSLELGTTTQPKSTSTPIGHPFSLDGRSSILIISSRIAGYSVYSWAKTKYEWNNSKEVSCASTIARTPLFFFPGRLSSSEAFVPKVKRLIVFCDFLGPPHPRPAGRRTLEAEQSRVVIVFRIPDLFEYKGSRREVRDGSDKISFTLKSLKRQHEDDVGTSRFLSDIGD